MKRRAGVVQRGATRVKTEAAAFDEEEYTELRRHYMEPVVTSNAELAMGQRLRRQTRPPRIEQNGPGWQALRKRVKALEQAQGHQEIYRLLRQLRDWELCPPGLGGRMPEALSSGAGSGGVAEVIDISDEAVIIDVDTYIIDMLVVSDVKKDPESLPTHVKHESVAVEQRAVVREPEDAAVAEAAAQPPVEKASAKVAAGEAAAQRATAVEVAAQRATAEAVAQVAAAEAAAHNRLNQEAAARAADDAAAMLAAAEVAAPAVKAAHDAAADEEVRVAQQAEAELQMEAGAADAGNTAAELEVASREEPLSEEAALAWAEAQADGWMECSYCNAVCMYDGPGEPCCWICSGEAEREVSPDHYVVPQPQFHFCVDSCSVVEYYDEDPCGESWYSCGGRCNKWAVAIEGGTKG